jgi:hypothetical protein
MRRRIVRLLAIAATLAGCGQAARMGKGTADSAALRAQLAGHQFNQDFGAIWPHDSTCFVYVESEVRAGRIPYSTSSSQPSTDPASDAFGRCVDSLEVLARERPLTPARRATLKARRAMRLPPSLKLDQETGDDSY